ncbi:MAG: phosphopantothenate/pantothenate synthetase [Candidatus Poseidoniia archaeon]|nr:phosphopantothenate/pantothenate synthetase [Candidatus Poseidoniia archaeon]MDP6846165.1 phosphopantothenate/pantothenate synthetase [Candidatus Poseidoniia archaeon]
MTEIPRDHHRYCSLLAREKLVAAGDLVAGAGLIAHGRGEAFDYLLGERTTAPARRAIAAAAKLLVNAERPVISVNGNVVALAAESIAELAAAIPAQVEVNLFHRTPERVSGLVDLMAADGVVALGAKPDFQIPGLSSERGKCCRAGIGTADVVLVPLEDGDRCQALVDMGKTVISIDLNPLSRTARAAHVTIVDELERALPLLVGATRSSRGEKSTGSGGGGKGSKFNNKTNLEETINIIGKHTMKASGTP